MQPIAEIATVERIQPGITWQTLESPPPRGIPQQVKLAHVDDSHPEMLMAVKAIRAWAKAWPEWNAAWKAGNRSLRAPSLVFVGPFGTGKTLLARVILWSMVECATDEFGMDIDLTAVPRGRFFTAGDLLLEMAAHQDHESKVVVPARPGLLLGNAPLIVIDDIGAEGSIPFLRGEDQEHERHFRYRQVIDYCYENGVSVIITSNLPLRPGDKKTLAEHIGGRAWDRLLQMCPRGSMVELWGVPSWRARAGGR
jgi:DNA replication protein DnaC